MTIYFFIKYLEAEGISCINNFKMKNNEKTEMIFHICYLKPRMLRTRVCYLRFFHRKFFSTFKESLRKLS